MNFTDIYENKPSIKSVMIFAGLSYLPLTNAEPTEIKPVQTPRHASQLSENILEIFEHHYYKAEPYESAEQVIEEFASKLLDGMQEMPADYAKTLRENFWDLL